MTVFLKCNQFLVPLILTGFLFLSAWTTASQQQDTGVSDTGVSDTGVSDVDTQPYSAPQPQLFADIPDYARLWCYYWWLKGNITKEQITHDLTEMHRQGFGGLLLFDSRRYHDDYDSKDHVPVPLEIKYEFMSEPWQDMVLHLVTEADRLGLKVSLNIADSGGVLRGPWDLQADGPKELTWTEASFAGGQKVSLPMIAPEDKRYYTDVAVMAVKLQPADSFNPSTENWNQTWLPVTAPTEKSPVTEMVIDLSRFVVDNQPENQTDNQPENQLGSGEPGKTLVWTVPAGNWKILRFGYHVVGDVGAVDILNQSAVNRYFSLMCDTILKKVGPLAGKTLTHFYNVSWEGSNPDWTPGMDETFSQLHGYKLRPQMPILAGLVIGDLQKSRTVQRDFYKTVSYSFLNHCYANIGNLCHDRGMVWHSEDGGPWRRTAPIFREADMLTFWGNNDIAQGEFWVNEKDNSRTRSNMRFAAMAAHLYGQRETAVEAFTHMGRHWTMYPALLKPAADVNFIDGANFFIWHTFTANLPEFGLPGMEYFAGTHINTNVTWFHYLRGFTDYMARCQYMLRQGLFTADACVWVSDRNYVDWGRGERWNAKSNMVLPKGYTYDLLDVPTLVDRLEYRNGRFWLPNGMSYRVLVIDPLEQTIPQSVATKIDQFKRTGAPIVESADQLAQKLTDVTPPDFDGPFEYHHRHTDQQEIYFLARLGAQCPEQGVCTFRTSGKVPTLWNPLDGTISPVEWSKTDDGRTTINLTLAENSTVFVVFDSAEKTAEKTGESTIEKTAEGTGKHLTSPLPVENNTSTASKTSVQISGPWSVEFDSRWYDKTTAGPIVKEFQTLRDWTTDEDPQLKYYSGTAVYRTTFELSQSDVQSLTTLSLGKIGCIGRVRLNGEDLGIVWTAPWQVRTAGKLQPGKNTLEVDVVNVWANRLIGDTFLPADQRYTRSNMYLYEKPGDIPAGGVKPFRRWQGFHKQDSLVPSGLFGPVTLH